MPTYDWKCEECNKVFEAVAGMNDYCLEDQCPQCGDMMGLHTHASRLFSPNKNIMIPAHFGMDRGWHLPPEGSTASSPDANSRVHAKPRESFRQQFDKNWKSAGGS